MSKLICFLPGPNFLIPGFGYSELGTSKRKNHFRQMKSANLWPRAVTMNAVAAEIASIQRIAVFVNFTTVKLFWHCVPSAREAKHS